ncbi:MULTISPECIES: hypothetical protein [Natrialbaceae]|uniref:hypothetical protein n=1 Tax=Natrialbaceae TaxID=1644061 RepID=UPI00207CAF3C|nr:hypothetical protein [Natronococcus sp. CG52]
MNAPDDIDPMYATLERTVRFVWVNLVSIVKISLAWFLVSLPIVTIGPATVGAYRAVLSLREAGAEGVDWGAVSGIFRAQFIHATLVGLVPPILLAVSGMYALAYLADGTVLAGLLTLGAAYAGLYAWLVSIPVLLGLAEGKPAADAITDGYLWTARHAIGAVALGIVTTVLLTVTSLLTVAVALLFAGVAFTLHIEFITETDQLTTSVPER